MLYRNTCRSAIDSHCLCTFDWNSGAWERIGRVDAFQPEGRGFESHSIRHVGTLDKSFTFSCL